MEPSLYIFHKFNASMTKATSPQPPLDSIKRGAEIIKASKSAKNIGIWLDSLLSMDVQINNICKTAFFHLCNIAKIGKFLMYCQCEILIRAFILSKLDYCNVLLSGLHSHKLIDYNMYKIQLPA